MISSLALLSCANIMDIRLCLCTARCCCSSMLGVIPRIGSVFSNKPNAGIPTMIICLKSVGCSAANKPAVKPPNEKPNISTACPSNACCSTSPTKGAKLSASLTSGGSAESPHPGKSRTHTQRVCAKCWTLRTQCVQLPEPPCNNTKGVVLSACSWPHTCQTTSPHA